MTSFSEATINIENLKQKIHFLCQHYGRDEKEIKLIAVSKKQSMTKILQFFQAGQIDFAENYAQEFRNKIRQSPPQLIWHFIGHLQSNKLKYIIGQTALIHSVDSLDLAKAIQEKAKQKQVTQNILLQMNISHEKNKFGFKHLSKNALLDLVQYKNINILGLMGMAEQASKEKARASFQELHDTLQKINDFQIFENPLKELSMGMSHDFDMAIAEGSTLIRIGTALMGERT